VKNIRNIRGSWLVVFGLCAGVVSFPGAAGALDNDDNLPDSPSHTATVSGHGDDPAAMRESSWRTLPRDFFEDQKAIWTFPVQLGKGRHLVLALAIVGGTAGLIYADPHIMPHFQNPSQGLDNLNDVFDPLITTAEVIAVPASLMVAGYIRHDNYQVGTAILAAEAYGDSAIVDLAVKAVSRRQRPSDIPPGGSFRDTFFNGGKSPLKGSSFPSGHSTGAFSVATVVASRYRNHRWVPWAVYGMATAVSLSRITSNAHFPSDVFLGAGLGYTITRFQVLRPR
jgi:membrane-associated phospholipid phosphatase